MGLTDRARAQSSRSLRSVSSRAGDDGLRRGVHEMALHAHAPCIPHHRLKSSFVEGRSIRATGERNARAALSRAVGSDQRIDGRAQAVVLIARFLRRVLACRTCRKPAEIADDFDGKNFRYQALSLLDGAKVDRYIRWPLSRKGLLTPLKRDLAHALRRSIVWGVR